MDDSVMQGVAMPFPESKLESREIPAADSGARASAPADAAEGVAGIEETLARCRRGENEGRRELFELFHRRVYRLAARLVGDGEAADVTQDVFLRVFQKIDHFRGESRFDTWLYRITLNECFQLLRRRGTRREQRLVNEPGDKVDRPFEQFEHRELMEQALQRLESELRTLFLLREVEGMNYAEIAVAMQIPEGTVASRLNRARRQLREILVELGWEP
jgi:RNA polymerase sigma-70 factor (ECF subfamily)